MWCTWYKLSSRALHEKRTSSWQLRSKAVNCGLAKSAHVAGSNPVIPSKESKSGIGDRTAQNVHIPQRLATTDDIFGTHRTAWRRILRKIPLT
jgi:hypothetical protein